MDDKYLDLKKEIEKINQRVKIIKIKTPIPKTAISLFIKLIISLAIIGIPPK